MGEFFHAWHRRIGVMTLIPALMFAAAWTRSFSCEDLFDVWITRHSCCHVISSNSSMAIAFAWEAKGELNMKNQIGIGLEEALMDLTKLVDWKSFPIEEEPLPEYFAWDWECCGFGFASEDHDPIQARALRIPDAGLVIPLTLLSAYLLLSKPRKSTQMKTVEPISTLRVGSSANC